MVYRLICIANPHGVDGTYNGSFHDNDPIWTEEFRKQVPNFTIANDGKFFMEIGEFAKSFEVFMINYIQDLWKINTHYVKGDDGTPKSYFFNNTKI